MNQASIANQDGGGSLVTWTYRHTSPTRASKTQMIAAGVLTLVVVMVVIVGEEGV